MADNVIIPATGSGDATPTVATDDVGGAHYQKIKVDGGGDGLSVPIVAGQQAMAASLPVVIASNQSAVPISGSVTATVTSTTVTGNVTVIQGTATNLKTQAEAYQGGVAVGAAAPLQVSLANTGANGTAVAVSAASLPLPALAATSTKQSDGSQKTQIVDGSGNVIASTSNALNVAITSGSSGNAAASATGSAVPADADYQGVNVGGTLRGITGVNPSGSIFAEQVDLASVAGATVSTGHGTAAGAVRVELPTDGTGIVGLAAGTTTAVTQATASSLNATVIGAGTAGTANAGVLTVQGIASMTKLLVTPDANSAVNVAQINGVTPLMGNGATGTGSLRVSIANDSTGIVALTTGSALVGYVGVKSTYAGKVTLTTTNWVSLANGSGWQSVAIDTTGARDVHFWLETQSTGTAYCDFYIATKLSNGTGYTDGATGTEGTFTAANRLNSRYLGSVRLNNAQGQGELCLSDIYGGALPKNIVLIGINNAGAAINGTGTNTVFEYELVN